MAEKRKYTTITIPAPLFDKLHDEIKDTGFSSVSDYVTFVLRETLAKMRDKGSGKDRDAVVSKLKALGYM
jgi:Arc/MetJ-type ribon-helix-helix transcriptional regulator